MDSGAKLSGDADESSLSKVEQAFIDAYTRFIKNADDNEAAADEVNTYLFDRYATDWVDGYPQPDAPDGLEELDDLPITFDDELDPDTIGNRFAWVVARLHGRSDTGSFYTPSEIVDFMTRSTVRSRLRDHLDDSGIDVSDIKDEREPEPTALANTCSPDEATELLAGIDSFSILDPACGSGEFLVGAVDEMADIRRAFADRANLDIPDPAHVWQSCANNVYGVDLVHESVWMARLRLKLRGLRALPSDPPDKDVKMLREGRALVWQVRQGNSLIGFTDPDDIKDAQSSPTGQVTLSGGAWT